MISQGGLCPCGRDETYIACCRLLHAGAPAPTAERLMRSRFSAFALGLDDYLLESWDSSTRPRNLDFDPETKWLRLFIEETEAGGPFDREGWVTFTAIARTPDGRLEQRERSRFTRGPDEHWRYLSGESPTA